MMEGTARKKNRKEKPGMSKNYGATQSYRNTLDSNRYLTYDILRRIFQYLDARDLGSAAMVCRSWSEAANNEKLIRGPCCFSILQLHPTDPEGSPDRETLARFSPCQCHVRKAEFKFDPIEFLYQMKNIRIKPSIGFFFIPTMSNTALRIIEDFIKKWLPEHCKAVMLYEKSIVLHNDFEWPESQSLACAFLPQIPNGRMTAKRWASAMQESQEVKIASVRGGELEDIYVQRIYKSKKTLMKAAPHQPQSQCVGVLITGFIQTWLTILDRKCDTEEQVEARLRLFKDEVKLKKHSIGFMFACAARRYNPESAIFKRLFPKVPLAGCFGFGVFGKTTTVDEGKNDEKEPKCKKSWYNEDSTVFLILTYG